jgi:predicted P-loop ATPase
VSSPDDGEPKPDEVRAEPTTGKRPRIKLVRPGPEPHGDWRDRLLYKKTREGMVIDGCTANAITILRADPEWSGILAWDQLAYGITTRRDPPWYQDDKPSPDPTNKSGAWRDSDGVRTAAWLRRKYSLSVSAKDAYMAALVVSEGARYDPLADWIGELAWDATSRAEQWLSTYLGANDTAYTRFIGKAFLVSAIARALDPGCKVDTMLVLEGAPGLKKSQAIKALFGERWFSDTPLELSSKDRFVGLRGLWCHEMAELDSFGRADAARIKTFLSSPTDDYRPPYGSSNVRVPRRCVFVGTVNPSALGYLVDDTGNRRIWPVLCGVTGQIDLEAIERDRELLWAEAAAMYGAGPKTGGVRWWPETPAERDLCNLEQEDRLVGDVWIGRIEEWLNSMRSAPGARVTIRELLSVVIGVELGKQTKAEQTRIGSCLHQLGWRVVARGGAGIRERYYSKV